MRATYLQPVARLLGAALLMGTLSAVALPASASAPLAIPGWSLVEQEDGTLRLTPPAPGAAVPKVDTSVLSVRGWNISREADGSLVLRSKDETAAAETPATQVATTNTSKDLAEAVPPYMDPETTARMEAAGWTVEHAEDGSVLLYPPQADEPEADPVAAEPVAAEPVAAEPVAADPAAAEPVAGVSTVNSDAGREPVESPAIMDAATIEKLLAHGWYVERAADGSVLLYPPVQEQVEAAPPAPPPPAAEPAIADIGDDALFGALEDRGWTLEREEDGTLLLYLQGSAPDDSTAVDSVPAEDTTTPASGEVTAALSDGGVTLPVNTWSEARAIADAWVAATGDASLAVGKIRHIYRVYLISIIDAKPPFSLRSQIAVRSEDGHVIVLN